MIYTKPFLILMLAAALSPSWVGAQSRTPWRLWRPCAGTSTPATVQIETAGDISITPCSGKTILGTVVSTGPNGTAAAPTYSFTADPDTGMFRSSVNTLGFSTGGVQRATLNSAGLFTTTGGLASTTGSFSGIVSIAPGTALDPTFVFSGDSDTGLFQPSPETFGFVTGGAQRGTLSSTGLFTTTGGLASTTGNFSSVVTFAAGGSVALDRTVTAGGTTGNQTINKMAGTVNVAAAGASITVTNSLVTATSIVFAVIRTADGTCTFIKSVVPGAGSFVVTLNAGCTAETSIGFLVTN